MCSPVSCLCDFAKIGPFSPFHCSPFPLPPHPLSQQLSVPILVSSTFTDVMSYEITDALSFSFPSPSSTEQLHGYTHVLRMSLCVAMLVSV
jgi:hypothetical protein